MAALRERILGFEDRKPIVVEVPEWGGIRINIAPLSSADRIRYREEANAEGANWQAIAVAWCAVEDDGKPIFTPADVAALAQKNGIAIERLYLAAVKLNRLSPEAVEEERKNS